MARSVRDSNLETRSARAKLKQRKRPYFRMIEPGLILGYRKLSGPGTWLRFALVRSRGPVVARSLRHFVNCFVVNAATSILPSFGRMKALARVRASALDR